MLRADAPCAAAIYILWSSWKYLSVVIWDLGYLSNQVHDYRCDLIVQLA